MKQGYAPRTHTMQLMPSFHLSHNGAFCRDFDIMQRRNSDARQYRWTPRLSSNPYQQYLLTLYHNCYYGTPLYKVHITQVTQQPVSYSLIMPTVVLQNSRLQNTYI
jgi:hypothetical protein